MSINHQQPDVDVQPPRSSIVFTLATAVLLSAACAADTTPQEPEVQGTFHEDTVFGPEACHSLDTLESCNAFEGTIEYHPEGRDRPYRWDGCAFYPLLVAGPDATCLERGYRVCVPYPSAESEEEAWAALGDGESWAWLSAVPDTVFPPGYSGFPISLPDPPGFDRAPMTESQRALWESGTPPICP